MTLYDVFSSNDDATEIVVRFLDGWEYMGESDWLGTDSLQFKLTANQYCTHTIAFQDQRLGNGVRTWWSFIMTSEELTLFWLATCEVRENEFLHVCKNEFLHVFKGKIWNTT